jgi:hypothetical protein
LVAARTPAVAGARLFRLLALLGGPLWALVSVVAVVVIILFLYALAMPVHGFGWANGATLTL